MTLSKKTSDINISEGDDIVRIDDTQIKSPEGVATTAHVIDRNTNKDLGNKICHNTDYLNTLSIKPKTLQALGRKRSY